MMQVVIVDYGSGNLRSAAKAFERAAGEAEIPASIVVSSDARQVESADRVVLPGVGAFADCKAGLERVSGLHHALEKVVIEKGRPFLGICVGMQLMATKGFEHGECAGLNWIGGKVVALTPDASAGPDGTGARIPHMGWNQLNLLSEHPVLNGFDKDSYAYFVHSYHVECDAPEMILATVDYGQKVTAAIGRDNMFGTQFHPEKSQLLGLRLIGNFLKWAP